MLWNQRNLGLRDTELGPTFPPDLSFPGKKALGSSYQCYSLKPKEAEGGGRGREKEVLPQSVAGVLSSHPLYPCCLRTLDLKTRLFRGPPCLPKSAIYSFG